MVLESKNIFINRPTKDKEEIIREIGDIFVAGGYTDEGYTESMLEKERIFNTAIGNAVAIPHGMDEAKRSIKKTGLVIMTFPNGQDWGADEPVKVVIGIAAVGDEHLDVLSKIAETLSEPSEVENLMKMGIEDICALFNN